MGKTIDNGTGERLLTGAELLKNYPPKHILFASDYSDITATDWEEIDCGNGVVIKSDLPLIVRLNRQEPIRNVYDLQITARSETFEIQRQNSGTFPDARTVIYSLWPGQVIRRPYRDTWDLPVVSQGQVITIAISTTTTLVAFAAPSYTSENRYLFFLQTRDTGGTGSQVLSRIDIQDTQGTPQNLWSRIVTANANTFTFVDLPNVKIPLAFNILLTHSSDAVNTNEITVDFNFRWR